MAKRKDSIALFEVIKGKDKHSKPAMIVPGWMGGSASPAGQAGAQGAPPAAAPSPGVPPQSAGALPAPADAPAQATARPAGEGLLRLEGGRVRISLSYLTIAVAALGLVLVMAGMVALGRATAGRGKSATVDNAGANAAAIGQAEKKPEPTAKARSGVSQRSASKNEDKGKGAPAVTERVDGKYYLVIQNMRGKNDELKAEAWKIRDFCEGHGKPATVNDWEDRDKTYYIVWSLTGFDSPDDPAAKQYAQEIEEIGKKYVAQGGKYNFMQRRTPSGPLSPMFIRNNVHGK